MDRERLRAELRRDEGVRRRVYNDSMGIPTIGVGRNLRDVGLTDEEVDVLLDNDIERVWSLIIHHIPWVQKLSDARQRVIANMAFNLGVSGLLDFKKTLAAIEAGQYEQAADMMLDSRWAGQVHGRATRLADMMRHG